MVEKRVIFSEPSNLSGSKIALFCTLALLHALDAFFSNIFMGVDITLEFNLLMASVYEDFGAFGIWAVKVVAFVPLAIILPYVRSWILLVLNIIMIPVVIFGGIMANGLSS